MTAQPVEANVVLTADNSAYDQAMQQSVQSTNQMAKSVDGLGAKIDRLTKSAGKKLLGITAADVALIGGATAAWANYEKQISRLQAQAAITTRSRETETKTLKTYTDSVKELRKQYGSTIAEAAELTSAISKMADKTRAVKDLSLTFQQMSQATGESSTGLATSLLQLQKMMGTPQRETAKTADMFTYLAAQTNTSATALIDFSSQIAPMGKAMGMTTQEIAGFSNMFIKAGQDGYSAATAFSKISQEITQAVQTGSPELNKYANVLGVTVEQFKGMSGAEQVAGFLDQIARLGPKAAQELNRFGFDGIRMSKAITGTVQASGGAMNALREAQVGYGSDATAEGAKAASSMSDTLAKLRQELQMTAEAFGKAFGPGLNAVLKGVTTVAGVLQDLMDGPLGKFLQMVAAVVAPVAAVGGALLLMATTITKLAGAALLLRNSGGLGFFEGLHGGARIVPGGPTGFQAFGGGRLGERGAAIAESGSWFQRMLYNQGQMIGGTTRRGGQAIAGLPIFAPGPEGGPNRFSRGLGSGIGFVGGALSSQFDQLRYDDPTRRSRWAQRYFRGITPEMAGTLVENQDATTGARRTLTARQATQAAVLSSAMLAGGGVVSPGNQARVDVATKEVEAAEKVVEGLEKVEKESVEAAEHEKKRAKESNTMHRTSMGAMAAARTEAGIFSKAMLGATANTLKLSAAFALSSARMAAGAGIRALGGPLNVAMLGATVGMALTPVLKDLFNIKEQKDYEFTRLGRPGEEYVTGAGGALPTAVTGVPEVKKEAFLTVGMARRSDSAKILQATAGAHKLSNKNLYGLDEKQVTNYLGANFSAWKDDPNAIQALSLDLIDKFDGPTAERILDNLFTGKFEQGPAPFYAQAMAEGDDAKKKKLLDLAASIAAEQELMAGTVGGEGAQFGARGRNLAGAFRMTFGAGPGNKLDPDVVKAINETYGLDLSETGIAQIRRAAGTPRGAAIAKEATPYRPGATDAEVIAKTITEYTDRGEVDRANAIKSALDIPLELTGKALVTAIEDVVGTTTGEKVYTPDEILAQNIREGSKGGALLMDDKAVQAALGFSAGNLEANLAAADSFMASAKDLGMTAPEMLKATTEVKSIVADVSKPESIEAQFIEDRVRQRMALQRPMMTRAGGFQADVAAFQAATAAPATTDEARAERQASFEQMAQSLLDQDQYFRQMITAHRQFVVQRDRAEEAYNLSRQYAQYDFNLSRERAEESFHLSRKRAVADYHKTITRATYDFNLQRSRQEEEFNHSVEVQSKQMAMGVYDIYHRVQTERTSSAEWILANAGDQLEKMREQSANLDKLRRQGLSDDVIQQMGLTDPAHAQQLARFVTELTPQMIAQFNKTAGAERIKAAKDLVTDPSSLEWQELTRGYELGRKQSKEDFDRQMELGRADFKQGLARQREDFGIMMDAQLEDFNTGMGRQADAYHLQMKQSAEDFEAMANEISMTTTEVFETAAAVLPGKMGKQADAAVAGLQDLRTRTSAEAISMMTELAAIFGFEYKIPDAVKNRVIPQMIGQAQATHQQQEQAELNRAQGGMIPGWSPGRDDRTVNVSGGEAIMRPEWARAVGKQAIDQMNHEARHGGFALGGIPAEGDWTQHPASQYPWARWAGDINVAGPGDYGNPVRAYKAGTVASVTYIGDRSYGRYIRINHPDTNEETLYAHLSNASVEGGDVVTRGQQIGAVGDIGNTTGPHLHFEIKGGTSPISLGSSSTGISGVLTSIAATAQAVGALKDIYHESEQAAYDMDGVHPLSNGMISQVINKFAKRRIRKMAKRPLGLGVSGLSDSPEGVPPAPDDLNSNQDAVRRAMLKAGFGASEWDSLYQLVMHESGFRNDAQNPTSTAYGMFQFLDSTWASVNGRKTSDPWLQAIYGMRYIENRYGSPSGAWDFWQNNNWYGQGAVFKGPKRIGVGESGPEAVIPLNAQGGEFMADVMARSVGMDSTPAGGGLSVYNTKVDRSTNFTGAITVQANNPEELLDKLMARKRVMALSRPSLTGSAA